MCTKSVGFPLKPPGNGTGNNPAAGSGLREGRGISPKKSSLKARPTAEGSPRHFCQRPKNDNKSVQPGGAGGVARHDLRCFRGSIYRYIHTSIDRYI